MKQLLVKNAVIVLPDAIIENGNILINGGKIVGIGDCTAEADAQVIDACGGYVMAGFIDVHVHGGGNADFMDTTAEAFETVVKSHLRYGTTLMTPTAMSASESDLAAFIQAYHAFRQTSAYGALTYGLHMEGPYFSGAGKSSSGAQPTDKLRYPDMQEVERLLALANGSIIRWDAAPELPGTDVFAKRLTKQGICVAIAHSDATADETEAAYANGFSHVTHFYNAVSMHRKREQTVYAGIVEATYLNDDVTIELIGDGCHIAKQDFQLAVKIKGAENVLVITDAMRLAGTELKQGKLGGNKNGTDCLVDDGVAKLMDLSSFAGSICTMQRALKVLHCDFGFDLPCVSVMMSKAPAKFLGCDGVKGSIEVGKDADLVLLDTALQVRDVFVGGECLYHFAG